MKQNIPPNTDSIQELAEFWQTHDLTDYDHELEEVSEPVFVRRSTTQVVGVPLRDQELAAVDRLAQSSGVTREKIVHDWIAQKIATGD